MKIYFNGCSWTRGAELEDYTQERYSKLLCDHYGAEEINLAYDGKSNDAIIREIYLDQPEPDLAVIQMTFPLRTEYYNVKERAWHVVNVHPTYKSWTSQKTEENIRNDLPPVDNRQEFKDFWTFYYTDIVSDVYLVMKERMQMEQIKSYFGNKDIPLVLLSINHFTLHDFDLNLSKQKYPCALKQHPTKEGHQMIKDDILNILKKDTYAL